jgi:ABC-type bacteriocin/lantibiotic exporter with double-glycine peptidase domain
LPVELIIIIGLLVYLLGLSVVVGLSVFVAGFPVQAILIRKLTRYREQALEGSDARVKWVQQCLQHIKLIKLSAWEAHFLEKVKSYRVSELRSTLKSMICTAGIMAWSIVSVFVLYLVHDLAQCL